MDRALHTRRRVLLTASTALAAGLAGCSDTSRSDEAPADSDARNDSTADGGMGGGNDSDGTDGETEGGPIGDADDVGSGELDEPPDNVEGDEGLGRGEDEGGNEQQGSTAATVSVGPGGELQYDPESVEIQQGETVRWEWGSSDHTVTPDATPSGADWEGAPESHDTDYVYEHTFETGGTYEYYCTNHSGEMTGEVVVFE